MISQKQGLLILVAVLVIGIFIGHLIFPSKTMVYRPVTDSETDAKISAAISQSRASDSLVQLYKFKISILQSQNVQLQNSVDYYNASDVIAFSDSLSDIHGVRRGVKIIH